MFALCQNLFANDGYSAVLCCLVYFDVGEEDFNNLLVVCRCRLPVFAGTEAHGADF